MDRYYSNGRVALIGLAFLFVTVTTNLAAPAGKSGGRTPGDRMERGRMGSFLGRLARGEGVRIDRAGRRVPIGQEELEFYARHLAIDLHGTPQTARVRMRLDHAARSAIEALGIRTYGALDGFASAVVPITRLKDLAGVEGIQMMQIVRRLRTELDDSVLEIRSSLAQSTSTFGARGNGVLVGTIDTGVDWSHDDFRNPDGTSRIRFLWSQDDACVGTPPAIPFDFGCLYTKADIDAAIAGTGSITAPDAAAHGTHVLGTAGGDGSATGNGEPAFTYVSPAPDADLIVVKTFREPGDPSCATCQQLGLGIDFIDAMATSLGMPYALNMSLGSNFGGHDGFDPDEVTIDTLTGAGLGGRVVVKSAGNGRGVGIHESGTVTTGSSNTHTFTIPSYFPAGGIFNDVQAWTMWYDAGDTLTIKISDPTSGCPGNNFFTASTGDGFVGVGTSSGVIIIDDAGSPGPGGSRFFEMELDDQLGIAPCPGTWTLEVTGDTITSSGRYDMWIWFSNFGTGGTSADWDTPDLTQLISVPGTAFNATTVGAYVTKSRWLSIDGNTYIPSVPEPTLGELAGFSSPGPSRDGRVKPEISAPGVVIASVRSSDASVSLTGVVPDGVHLILQGTSMAAPHVTGVYAQMLGINPTLDAIQLRTLVTGAARTDAQTGATPNNDWGFGKIDALAALEALVKDIPDLKMLTPTGGGWTGIGTADTYNVYRANIGTTPGAPLLFDCLPPSVPTPSFTDTATPGVGTAFAYTMTGVKDGVEGLFRFDPATGTGLPPPSPCL